jgi:hypothetical protein
MNKSTPPTEKELQRASDVIRRYGATRKETPEDRRINRQIKKDKALANECEETANKIFQVLYDQLPDEKSKKLLQQFTLVSSGRVMLQMRVQSAQSRSIYAQSVKEAKKLLSGKNG